MNVNAIRYPRAVGARLTLEDYNLFTAAVQKRRLTQSAMLRELVKEFLDKEPKEQ